MSGDILLHAFLMIVGVCLPLAISVKGKSAENNFKLRDLSKILAVVPIYYSVFFLYNVFVGVKIDVAYFLFYEGMGLILATTFIALVLKYSPSRAYVRGFVGFPKFERTSVNYILILSFFILVSFAAFVTVDLYPLKVERKVISIIYLKAINEGPFSLTPLLVISEFISVIAEEFVFRYFAINAFNKTLANKSSILISSFIFTLLHLRSSFGIFILGIFLGYIYVKTESIALCSLLHFFFNIASLSMSLYLFYKDVGIIAVPPYQYALALLFVQVVLYHLAELVFRKSG